MLDKALFNNFSRREIIAAMKNEGFVPKLCTDKPDYIYEPHKHPDTKYLVCLKGSMIITVNGGEINFEPGDKLIIPGNTMHGGLVSKEGCMYFSSEKLINEAE